MKLYFDLPLGVPIMGTPFKFDLFGIGDIVSSIIGGMTTMASNAQNHRYTKEQMRLQDRLNKGQMEHSMGLQRGQQDYLMNTMYGKQVGAMKSAGLNPAGNSTGVAGMSAPSGGSPTSGASGPGFSGHNIAEGLFAGANLLSDLKVKQAQAKDLDASAKLKDKQAENTEADTVIKQWQGSPRYRQLVEDGLSAKAAESWASAGLNQAKSFEAMKNVQYIGKLMNKTDAEINNLQASTAKLYSDVLVNLSQSEFYIASKKAQEAAAKELMSRSKLNDAQSGYFSSLKKTEDDTREHKVSSLKAQAHEAESNAKLNESEEALKNYYVESLNNIPPNSTMGVIYSHMDRVGSFLGQLIGAGASLYGAGRISKAMNRPRRISRQYHAGGFNEIRE